MQILYRLSDNGYVKPKFPNATKMHCLQNAIKQFGSENLHLFVDETNLAPNTRHNIEALDAAYNFPRCEFYQGGSSAGSFRHVFEFALSGHFAANDTIMFSEDDYLYLDGVARGIDEALQVAHYVTPYLHGDRFIPAERGGSQHAQDFGTSGGFSTWIFRTTSAFWCTVESTTMTFATTVHQLESDRELWAPFIQGTHPNDYGAFCHLTTNGKSLVAPIPTLATHAEPAWQSPLIGTGVTAWEDV